LAPYFGWRGRPLYKPDYMIKVFDKVHSVMWPNAILILASLAAGSRSIAQSRLWP
jgi:hypothetical protein